MRSEPFAPGVEHVLESLRLEQPGQLDRIRSEVLRRVLPHHRDRSGGEPTRRTFRLRWLAVAAVAVLACGAAISPIRSTALDAIAALHRLLFQRTDSVAMPRSDGPSYSAETATEYWYEPTLDILNVVPFPVRVLLDPPPGFRQGAALYFAEDRVFVQRLFGDWTAVRIMQQPVDAANEHGLFPQDTGGHPIPEYVQPQYVQIGRHSCEYVEGDWMYPTADGQDAWLDTGPAIARLRWTDNQTVYEVYGSLGKPEHTPEETWAKLEHVIRQVAEEVIRGLP